MDYDVNPRLARAQVAAAEIDEGLRSYMLSVYNYMALALALTGLTAYVVSTSPAALQVIFGTPLKWVVMLAPLGFVIFLSARIHAMSLSAAQIAFWGFAVVMGLSMASIFLVFTATSIARVFFITAATFGAMSLYGYTTKRDLAQWGTFLFMGLVGVVIASLINIFLASSALHFVLSIAGVIVFVGLTAYDTQAIKEEYYEGDAPELASRKAIYGALRLYLDFINMFVLLLQFFGQQRD
ncbi:Inner membrane protein YbhL [bacterium HR40]|nr:Inner membrane protein YbhL [bacterium HR40]